LLEEVAEASSPTWRVSGIIEQFTYRGTTLNHVQTFQALM